MTTRDNAAMTPQEELAVIRPDAIRYKGVCVDLPEPVAKYIDSLIAERHSAMQVADRMHDQLLAAMDIPKETGRVPWEQIG